MEREKQVILGNSAASLSAISAIRSSGSSCPITVVSAENCRAYSPVLITYYISQKIGRDDLFITDDRFYRERNVKTIFGNRAVGIDPSKQTVYLEDDTKLEYDNLLIATGASAKYPSADGANLPGILTLRTIEDAEKIIRFSKGAQEIVILGAGQISLQVANACIQGRIAGLNMAGYPEKFNDGLNENITSIFGLTLATIGLSKSAGGNFEELKYADDKREVYRKFLLTDNRIIGAILLNKIGDAGIIRSLIVNRTDITPWKGRMAKAPLNFGTELFSIIS